MDVARMVVAVGLLGALSCAEAGQAVTTLAVSVNVVEGCQPALDPLPGQPCVERSAAPAPGARPPAPVADRIRDAAARR